MRPPSAAGPTSQIELPIEKVMVGATRPAVCGRPGGQRTLRKGSGERGSRNASGGRKGRSSGRPVQPVPRLLLSRKEAAASLGMSLDTFERRVQPAIKLVPCGQLVLVPLGELESWCEDHAHYLAGAQ
jgi:hypothetical protein